MALRLRKDNERLTDPSRAADDNRLHVRVSHAQCLFA